MVLSARIILIVAIRERFAAAIVVIAASANSVGIQDKCVLAGLRSAAKSGNYAA